MDADWQLVIFDCDGVLVDSEPIANRVLVEMLRELGLDFDLEQSYRIFAGRTMTSCLELIEPFLGRPTPPDFVETYNVRTLAAFERELRPVPGAAQALAALRWPFCVATSASHRKLRAALAATELLSHCEGRLFSAADVGVGKPDPALFLHAARTMGAAPARCAVIEDTLVGVEAGRAAGMSVFGYASTTDATRLAEAGAIPFADMGDLVELLETHRPGRPPLDR